MRNQERFLDSTSSLFATAEIKNGGRKITEVQPLCQALFKDIMFSPVIPALQKPEGSGELAIKLAEFWTLKDVSVSRCRLDGE